MRYEPQDLRTFLARRGYCDIKVLFEYEGAPALACGVDLAGRGTMFFALDDAGETYVAATTDRATYDAILSGDAETRTVFGAGQVARIWLPSRTRAPMWQRIEPHSVPDEWKPQPGATLGSLRPRLQH